MKINIILIIAFFPFISLGSALDQYAIVVFYRNDCGYCYAQQSVLNKIKKKYNITVSYVDYKKSTFSIPKTPYTVLLKRYYRQPIILSEGFSTFEEMETELIRGINHIEGNRR
ncbi:MAG: conjugal transfer protein TraF [Desulfobacterales bacterium]|nr:conjugal transfer protein TraF [Desulfobacterales bacterium]